MDKQDENLEDIQIQENDLQEHDSVKEIENDKNDEVDGDQSYEIQEMLPLGVLDSFQELNESINELSKSIQVPNMKEIVKPIIEQQKESIIKLQHAMQIPALKQLNEMSEQLRHILKSLQNVVIPKIDIDFDEISELAREKLEEIKEKN